MASRTPGAVGGIGPSLIVLAAALIPFGLRASPAGQPQKLSLEQKKQLAELTRKLPHEPFGSEAWFQAAGKVLGFGEPGAKELLPIVEVKLRGLERDYRHAFHVRAKRLRAEKLPEAAKKLGETRRQLEGQIKQARRDVLELAKTSGLDKNDIIAKGDPAMKKLNELTIADRAEVLDGSQELKDQRQLLYRLLELRGKMAASEPPDAEQHIAAAEELSCLLALPINSAMRRILEHNARVEGKLSPEEAEGIRDLNRMRLLLGLPALRIDLRLCQAARDHSRDMRTRKFFSHDSPVPGKETPWKRAKQAGTTASAENIAAGPRTGRGAIGTWFHSPGHFKNMLGSHQRVGIGHDGGKWTQMFGR